MYSQFRKAMNALPITQQIKYLEIGSRIVKVVIPIHPHVNIIHNRISGERTLFTDFWLCSGTWKLGPLCLFVTTWVSWNQSRNYYHRVIVFIELEIKISPGDKMSLCFMLAHIYQFTVIEPRPSVEFRACKMAGIDVLMSTPTETHAHTCTHAWGWLWGLI